MAEKTTNSEEEFPQVYPSTFIESESTDESTEYINTHHLIAE